jgi:glutamate-5-semialdehyde dehydrogenase
MSKLTELGQQAKAASYTLSQATAQEKNDALEVMARALKEQSAHIIEANKKDVANAKDNGITDSMVDRLVLNEERITAMADGLMDIATLPDPVGRVTQMWTTDAGLRVGQETVPLGVVGIIYESRPNVTSDAAGLCFKSGNAVILRGGKEAIHSNRAIVNVLQSALEKTTLPKEVIQLVPDTSRETATEMMRLNQFLDVLIPRGGAGLIQAVVENATVPVIETGTGNCHIYVDKAAQKDMAKDIVVNAKVTKPAACNSVETLLIHEEVAEEILPAIEEGLKPFNVSLRADEKAGKILENSTPATEEDWETEYLDFILAVKVVSSLEEAITHINHYSTSHSEAIVTDDYFAGKQFQRQIDSAAVYINASTRFTDGFEFGFGAEIGISTQKLHARGPMGLPELTSTKFIVFGEGHTRL